MASFILEMASLGKELLLIAAMDSLIYWRSFWKETKNWDNGAKAKGNVRIVAEKNSQAAKHFSLKFNEILFAAKFLSSRIEL